MVLGQDLEVDFMVPGRFLVKQQAQAFRTIAGASAAPKPSLCFTSGIQSVGQGESYPFRTSADARPIAGLEVCMV